ncbi:MAG: AraC family transcriptional regulator [Eubacteriales bacterium]|nr:AraC family transcriptional regulator [Eubacteriales bacterium]
MDIQELEKLLYIMTEAERNCQRGDPFRANELNGDQMDFCPEEANYIMKECGMHDSPVAVAGYLDAAKNYEFLNIVASKHTRFSEVPAHRHEFVEMSYVLEGNVEFVINQHEIHMKQGDICIMDSHVVHSVKKTGEKDMMLNIQMPKRYFNTTFLTTLANVELVTGFLGEIISNKTSHEKYWLLHCQESGEIRHLFERVFCEFLEPAPGSVNAIRYYIGLILIEAVRCSRMDEEKTKKEKESFRLADILQYIDEHCTDCTLKELADAFGYSSDYFSRKLRQKTGKSFQELVGEQRMNRVVLQLKNMDASIAEIANNCGFQNLSFFYRKFNEKFGITPKEFRDRMAGEQIDVF